MSKLVRNVPFRLLAWRDGNQNALDQLIPLVHEELRRLAPLLRRFRPGDAAPRH